MFEFGMKPTPQGFGAQTWDQVGTTAGMIMGEAGGESDRGKAMVADTLYNRMGDPYFSNTFGTNHWEQANANRGGYYQYNAMKPQGDASWRTVDSVRKLFNSPQFQADPWQAILGRSDAKQLTDTLSAMRGVFGTGELRGVAGGAQYYANPTVVLNNSSPEVIRQHQLLGMNNKGVTKVGNHEFYGQGASGKLVGGAWQYPVWNSRWHGTTNPYTDSLGMTSTGMRRGGEDTPVEMRNSGSRIIEMLEQPSLFGNSNRYLDLFVNDLTNEWQKGGTTGTGYRYDPSSGRYYLNNTLKSNESNNFGYGGYAGYDPAAYGYHGSNYSTGDPQSATGAVQEAQYMWLGAPQREDSYFGRAGFGTPIVNQYGMPDITVYANPRQWWGGANDGSSGNMGSAGGIQTGSHASVLDNPNTGGTVGASDGGFTASIGQGYFDSGQQAAQQQFNYQQQVNNQTQNQINQNISGLNPMNNPQAIWV
jgi:hypothetical protein